MMKPKPTVKLPASRPKPGSSSQRSPSPSRSCSSSPDRRTGNNTSSRKLGQKLGQQFGVDSDDDIQAVYTRIVASAAEGDEVPSKLQRLEEDRAAKVNNRDTLLPPSVSQRILTTKDVRRILEIQPSNWINVLEFLQHGAPSIQSELIKSVLSEPWVCVEEADSLAAHDKGILNKNNRYLRSLKDALTTSIPLSILAPRDEGQSGSSSDKKTQEELRLNSNGYSLKKFKMVVKELEAKQLRIKALKDDKSKVLNKLQLERRNANGQQGRGESSNWLPDLNTLKDRTRELLGTIRVVLQEVGEKYNIRQRNVEDIYRTISRGKVEKEDLDNLDPASISLFISQLQILRIETTGTKSRLKINDFY